MMNTNNERPYFGDHLYIPGLPNKNFGEECADCCLLFNLSENPSVKVIENGDECDIQYSSHGCITELFSKVVSSLPTDSCLAVPVFPLVGLAYFITAIIAKPFELIGKCFKNNALESNPEAKAYNELAANHLQYLHEREATYGELEIINQEIRSIVEQLDIYEEIYKIACKATESPPERFIRAKFGHIPLVIKPLSDDYEIVGPLPEILPTTLSRLYRIIKTKKNILGPFERNLQHKLPLFQMAQAQFQNDLKPFLINEKTPLGAT